jgi:hypothetical protein
MVTLSCSGSCRLIRSSIVKSLAKAGVRKLVLPAVIAAAIKNINQNIRNDNIDRPFWLVDGVRKPMFDYERMLYKALLEPGYLNSTPSLHSDDPPSLNVCQSISRACLQKYKSLGKYSCHVRARNTNTLREIWVLILLSS